jgi:hypothetical protein
LVVLVFNGLDQNVVRLDVSVNDLLVL